MPPSSVPQFELDRELDTPWLAAFHRGDRATLEVCYREHFVRIERALRPLLEQADRETVIHELFSRLIADGSFRRAFRGGSLAAWLATTARNQAIDFRRRLNREWPELDGDQRPDEAADNREEAAHARLLIADFRHQLPDAWQGVFELRFLQQLPQREAAARLSLHRTTLVYREIRIRRSLRRFVLSRREP